MSRIKLTIHKGLRLHFCLGVGCYGRWLSGRLNNKEKLIMHLIKDLRWRVKFFDCDDSGDYLFRDWVELEADVEDGLAEDLENALKALMRIRAISKRDLERLKAKALRNACKELNAMLVLG